MLTARLLAKRVVDRVGGEVFSYDENTYVALTSSAVVCFRDGYPIMVHIIDMEAFDFPASMVIWNDDNFEELIGKLEES